MRALWLEDGVLSYRENLEAPRVKPGEALLRISHAGICNTDLELVKGYYPFTGVPGHEFVGIIADCPGSPERVGERVVGSINAVCHQCDMCRRGLPGHCRERTVLGIAGRNGVFAEFAALPLENLHTVPDHVSDVRAVFTEPLAAALQVTEQTVMHQEDRILVAGSGKLGQLISEALMALGHNAEAVPRYPGQRERLERLGITCLPAGELVPFSYDIVIEATGSPGGLEMSLGLVRPRGVLILKSTYQGKAVLDVSRIVVDEITLQGSRCGPVAKALELLSGNRIIPETMVDAIFPLEQGPEAFAAASEKGAGKIILRVSGPGMRTEQVSRLRGRAEKMVDAEQSV